MTPLRAQHSSRPFPLLPGKLSPTEDVDAGDVPQWMADIARTLMSRVAGSPLGLPTLDEISRHGGFHPLYFLDLLGGGNGDGAAFANLEARDAPLLAYDLTPPSALRPPSDQLSKVTIVSALGFPVQGGRVSDGDGLDPGFVPRYIAEIAHRRLSRQAARRGVLARVPPLEHIERKGGYHPFELLDLLAGGNGSGQTFAALISPKLRARIADVLGGTAGIEIEKQT
jgi:hypothetical protein